MLMQIPGVSANVAHCIMKKYGSIKNLLQVWEEDSTCLYDFQYVGKGDKFRSLNKTCIENIAHYLIEK